MGLFVRSSLAKSSWFSSERPLLEPKLGNIEGSLSSTRSDRGSLDSEILDHEGKLDADEDGDVSVDGGIWPLLEAVIELEDQKGLVDAGELELVSKSVVTGSMLAVEAGVGAGTEAGAEARTEA